MLIKDPGKEGLKAGAHKKTRGNCEAYRVLRDYCKKELGKQGLRAHK